MEIHRGEVWMVDFGSGSRGAEIRKRRPAVVVTDDPPDLPEGQARAVVISDDAAGALPLRVVVPLTSWQSHFASAHWLVRIDPNERNGLDRIAAADVFQVRSLSIQRFISRLGTMSADDMKEVVTALGMIVHHPVATRGLDM